MIEQSTIGVRSRVTVVRNSNPNYPSFVGRSGYVTAEVAGGWMVKLDDTTIPVWLAESELARNPVLVEAS